MRISTLMLFLFGLTSNLQAANRFWIASSNGNWNNEANWSTSSGGTGGASVPGASDLAIFDINSVGFCTLDIDVEVRGFDLRPDFIGTVFQSSHSLKVGNQHLQVSGGTLEGGTAQIDLDGNITIDGGTFIASSDSLFSAGQFIITSGNFVHNNGTVVFNSDVIRNFRCDNVPAERFFNVIMDGDSNHQLRIRNGDTLMVNNRLDLIRGSLRNGTLGISGTSYCTQDFDSGNTNVAMLSTGETEMYIGNGAWLNNNLTVDKGPGSSLTFIDLEDDGELVLGSNNRNLNVQSGHLILPAGDKVVFDYRNVNIYDGGALVSTKDTLVIKGSYINFGGDIVHNGGTVAFEGDANSTFRCDSVTPDRFYNVSVRKDSNRSLNIRNGDTLYVENRLDLNTGALNNSAVCVEDTCVVYSGWNQGTSRLIYRGPGDGHLLLDAVVWDMHDIIIHKANLTDKVTIEDMDGDGSVIVGSINRRITVNRGMLDFESGIDAQFNFLETIISADGTLVGSDHALSLNGSYLNQGGRFLHNNGLVRFIGGTNSTFRCNTVPTDSFYNVEVALDNSADLNLVNGDTLKVLNRLDLIRGQADVGMLAVRDTLFLHAGWEQGTADISFIGSGDGHYLIDFVLWTLPDMAIEKASPDDIVWVEDVDGDGVIVLGGDNRYLEIRKGILAFDPGTTVDLDFRQIDISAGGTLMGTSGLLNIKGNYLNYGGQFLHNSGTVRFHGPTDTQFRSDVSPADLFNNVIIQKTTNRDLNILGSGNLHVANDLYLLDGQLRIGTVQVDGDVLIDSLFDQGNAPLMLTGTTDQEITVNVPLGNYSSDITIDKPVGSQVILQTPLRMYRSGQRLYLNAGVITTTSSHKLIMTDNVSWQNASTTSYVNGPLEKIGNDAFTFPLGKDGIYAPIGISNPSSSGHSFTAEYFPSDPGVLYDSDSKVPSIFNISTAEYWILDRGATTTSNVFVTLSWDVSRSGEINNPSDLVVARWDDAEWQDHGNFVVGTPSATSGMIRTAARVTDFSPFTFGSISPSNPLPVEWLYFQAELEQGVVELEWATASEIHSEDFEIQRSHNGLIWDVIGKVDAAGYSSSQLTYQSKDYAPLSGVSYYRLKQNDFDGQFEYSEMKAIDNASEVESGAFAFPNPTEGIITVQGDFTKTKELRVYDLRGADLTTRIQVDWISNSQVKLDLNFLPVGIYFLHIGEDVIRILKN